MKKKRKELKYSHLSEEAKSIYDAITDLMVGKHWEFLNNILKDKTAQIWRTSPKLLIGYMYATQDCKSMLDDRNCFVKTCKQLYPSWTEKWEEFE